MRSLFLAATAAFVLTTTTGAAAYPASDGPLWPMAYFMGTWMCSGVFPSSGKTIASTISFTTDLVDKAIVKHHDDTPPNSYRALEVWVFDAKGKRFNMAVADNYGGVRDFSSTGWSGSSLVFTSEPSVKPPQQFAYEKVSMDQFKLDWRVARDGTNYVVGDTLTCDRLAPPK